MRLLPIYIIIVLTLHIIPFGSASFDLCLNRIQIGAFRLDHLLHSAVFLPWMFLSLFRFHPGSGTGAGTPVRRLPLPRYFSYSAVSPRRFGLWLVTGIVFATAAEGIQYWLPYRSFTLMDVLFNILGVVISAALAIPVLWFVHVRRDAGSCCSQSASHR